MTPHKTSQARSDFFKQPNIGVRITELCCLHQRGRTVGPLESSLSFPHGTKLTPTNLRSVMQLTIFNLPIQGTGSPSKTSSLGTQSGTLHFHHSRDQRLLSRQTFFNDSMFIAPSPNKSLPAAITIFNWTAAKAERDERESTGDS